MPRKKTILRRKQLLVEGRDAEAFFHPFLEHLGLDNIQIQDFGGISELASFLKQFVLNPQYRQLPVTAIGIMRDAEQNANDAFRSIVSALEKSSLPKPVEPITYVGQEPKVGVYLLPDNEHSGMIETLLLKAVCDTPVFECVDRYIDCVTQQTDVVPSPLDKARFLTYLASKPDIKPLTGFAARAGYLNFNSPVYEPLKEFLRSL